MPCSSRSPRGRATPKHWEPGCRGSRGLPAGDGYPFEQERRRVAGARPPGVVSDTGNPLEQLVDVPRHGRVFHPPRDLAALDARSEEHTSELQSRENLVCRLLLEKKK